MKIHHALFVLALAFAGACATQRAQEAAVVPPALQGWDGEAGVEGDVLRGIADALTDGDLVSSQANALFAEVQDLELALRESDLPALRLIEWQVLESYARRGVQDRLDDGEIGPGVAESLLERIRNIADAFADLKGTRIQ